MKNKYEVECTVDENGCIIPGFRIESVHTSGYLKYFFAFIGKRVRITIEVLD